MKSSFLLWTTTHPEYWWPGRKLLLGGWSTKHPEEHPDPPSSGVTPRQTRSDGWLGGDSPAGPLERLSNGSCPPLAAKGDPATTALPRGQAAPHPLWIREKKVRNDWLLTVLPTSQTCMGALFVREEEEGNLLELGVVTCTWDVIFWHLWHIITFLWHSLMAVKQEQYLPTAAPAIQHWQRAFRSSGGNHHWNSGCCSSQWVLGHPGLAQGSPSPLCNRPNTTQCPHNDPSLTCTLAILRLFACH